MGRKLGLDVTQQVEAVLSMLRREEPAGVIARRYGISENTLYRLRERFLESGKAGLAKRTGHDKASANREAKLERAVAERDRVIGELTIANRILKKVSDGSP
jgi:transposase